MPGPRRSAPNREPLLFRWAKLESAIRGRKAQIADAPPDHIRAGHGLGDDSTGPIILREPAEFLVNKWVIRWKWFKLRTASDLRFRRSEAVSRSG